MKLNEKPSTSTKVTGHPHTLSCNSCGLKLGVLFESGQVSKKFDRDVKYQVICRCNGESFAVKSRNECYFVQEPNLSLKSVLIDDASLIIRNVITLE